MIDNMLAGKKLDFLMARDVMGIDLDNPPFGWFITVETDGTGPDAKRLRYAVYNWHPSINTGDMWDVVAKITRRATSRGGWEVRIESDGEGRWCCTFFNDPLMEIYAYAPTVPLAICRAASKVVRSKEWIDGGSE